MRSLLLPIGFALSLGCLLGTGCSEPEPEPAAEVTECMPEDACSCMEGVERETACSCTGGSSCSIEGDNIEFSCEGNADCGLTCGENCLITCPGTSTCNVEVGDEGVVECPGTATCNITCLADCTVNVAGAATANVDCVNEEDGAVCTVN